MHTLACSLSRFSYMFGNAMAELFAKSSLSWWRQWDQGPDCDGQKGCCKAPRAVVSTIPCILSCEDTKVVEHALGIAFVHAFVWELPFSWVRIVTKTRKIKFAVGIHRDEVKLEKHSASPGTHQQKQKCGQKVQCSTRGYGKDPLRRGNRAVLEVPEPKS